ncbi:MAG: hypothetical protein EU541_04120 [Promethearchaeota archaeon]|nr:MAG: hypothetical protein EU541_04120 [Candidatus Lokiarchaeota archaeon]
MPLEESHLLQFLNNPVNERFNSEMLELLIKEIDQLCFKQCQVDRITCTLNPMCTRRFLLNLRIKKGLDLEELPKFCYSVQKGVIERYLKGRTVVYKPSDSYLFLIDFLDIFFHENYRRLNKFITFENWEEAEQIMKEETKDKENITYQKINNYLLIKYEDELHVVFLDKGYALCNADKEGILDIELIKGIIDLYSKILFPEVYVKLAREEYVKVRIKIPNDIVSNINNINKEEELDEESSEFYFQREFHQDIFELSNLCSKISLGCNFFNDLIIDLIINNKTYEYKEKKTKTPLRYRDLKQIINFLDKIYNKYYVIWI